MREILHLRGGDLVKQFMKSSSCSNQSQFCCLSDIYLKTTKIYIAQYRVDIGTAVGYLEGQVGTSARNDGGLDARGSGQGVRVRSSGKGTSSSGVGSASEVVALEDGIASIGGVNGLRDAAEDVVLNEELSAVTGVDAIVGVLVVVVEDVA